MKTFKYIAAVLIIFTSACQKEKIETYKGVDNIYFSPAWVSITPGVKLTDSIYVSFVFETMNVDQLTVKIPVRVQGLPSQDDRSYLVELSENSTAVENEDISALSGEHMFKAGQVIDTLEFLVYRSDKLKTETKYAEINLLPNEHFSVNLNENVINKSSGESINCLTFRVYFDDVLGTPKFWSVGFLGDYSEKKLRLISGILDVPLYVFSGETALSIMEVRYIGKSMQKYLDEQEAKGSPVLDEDGTPMKMGNNL